MAQNYWQQECTIFYHIYPYLEVWRYDSQHDHICGPIVRNPNSEPHPNVKFSLTGAVSKSRTVPTAAQHELVLDSKKTNQLCKEPSKTETKKTPSCDEFEQRTTPFLPACGLLMIHDISADKWISYAMLFLHGHSVERKTSPAIVPNNSETNLPAPSQWTFVQSTLGIEMSSLQLFNENTRPPKPLKGYVSLRFTRWIPPFWNLKLSGKMGRVFVSFCSAKDLWKSLLCKSKANSKSCSTSYGHLQKTTHRNGPGSSLIAVRRIQFHDNPFFTSSPRFARPPKSINNWHWYFQWGWCFNMISNTF